MSISTDIETVESLGRNFDEFARVLEFSKQNLESFVDGVGQIWEAEAYNKFKQDTLKHTIDLIRTAQQMRQISEELQTKANYMRRAWSDN